MNATASNNDAPNNDAPRHPPLVLLVEDELLVAESIAATLTARGCEVLGPVATVDQARALLAEQQPDLALIDYRLARGTTEPLLEDLTERSIPACVLTGYGKRQLPCTYDGYPVLEKPFKSADLMAVVDQMCDEGS